MRLLFLNLYYKPDPAATAQMLSDLAEDLARRGHEVHVWCSRSSYDGQARPLPRREEVDGVRVERLPATRLGKGRMRRRALDYASYLGMAATKLAFGAKRWDAVVALTTPPGMELLGAIARWRGTAFVSWQMDLFPEIAVAEGMAPEGGPLAQAWKAIQGFGLRRADRVVCLGEAMREELLAGGRRIDPRRAVVQANWTNDEEVRPRPPAECAFRAELGAKPGDFVVMYSGNMGLVHPLESLLGAARILEREDRGVRFAFVGHGRRRQEVVDAIAAGATSIRLLDYQPREALGDTLPAADLHVVSLKPGVARFLVPCKLYGVLAAGRPAIVLGGGGGEVARVVAESGAGVALEDAAPERVAAAIRALRADPARVEAMGRAGRAWLDAKGSRRLALANWRRIIREAVGEGRE